jgi:hypothetical protein
MGVSNLSYCIQVGDVVFQGGRALSRLLRLGHDIVDDTNAYLSIQCRVAVAAQVTTRSQPESYFSEASPAGEIYCDLPASQTARL